MLDYQILLIFVSTKQKNKTMKELQKKLQDLQEALKDGSISTNYYSSMYHATYQQIKKLNGK